MLQQAKPKSCNSGLPFRIGFRGPGDQYAEPPYAIRLLRQRRERPGSRTNNSFYEIAPSHCLPKGSGVRRLSFTGTRLQQGITTGGMGPTVILHRNRPQAGMSALGQKQTFGDV